MPILPHRCKRHDTQVPRKMILFDACNGGSRNPLCFISLLIQLLLALRLMRGTLKADLGFERDCNAHLNFKATFSEKTCTLELCKCGKRRPRYHMSTYQLRSHRHCRKVTVSGAAVVALSAYTVKRYGIRLLSVHTYCDSLNLIYMLQSSVCRFCSKL